MAINSSCVKFLFFFLFVGIFVHHARGATIEVTIEAARVSTTTAQLEYSKNINEGDPHPLSLWALIVTRT